MNDSAARHEPRGGDRFRSALLHIAHGFDRDACRLAMSTKAVSWLLTKSGFSSGTQWPASGTSCTLMGPATIGWIRASNWAFWASGSRGWAVKRLERAVWSMYSTGNVSLLAVSDALSDASAGIER